MKLSVKSFYFALNGRSLRGFTLIELMIAVAIIAVLSAVAIPTYTSYIRRSRLAEVNSGIAAIKTAQEDFFSRAGCYTKADPHPAAVPAGTTTAWGDTPPFPWNRTGLSVRPDRNVRFQYEVLASNEAAVGTLACGPGDTRPPPAQGCIDEDAMNALVPEAVFDNNWYIVIARGDQDADATNSVFVSAIDDSAILECDPLE